MRNLFTIGHSTRPLEDLIQLLRENSVTLVADVRTIPRSRHNPQFNREVLPASLAAAGIGYVHLAGLGGLRRPLADSPNGGWRNLSFRGFADYMQTDDFNRALDGLVRLAESEVVCLMCAEAVPWRCHRWLISDALAARGIIARHIMGSGQVRPHVLTPWAKVEDGRITYSAAGSPPVEGEASGGADTA